MGKGRNCSSAPNWLQEVVDAGGTYGGGSRTYATEFESRPSHVQAPTADEGAVIPGLIGVHDQLSRLVGLAGLRVRRVIERGQHLPPGRVARSGVTPGDMNPSPPCNWALRPVIAAAFP